MANSLRSPVSFLLICVAYLTASTSVFADLFQFKDGRIVSGKVKSEFEEQVGEKSEKGWAVEIAPNTFVKVHASQLVGLKDPAPTAPTVAEKAYMEEVRIMADTVDEHLKVAGWCNRKGLREFEDAHYKRVLDLEPDNPTARAALKYRRDANGRWVKSAELMGGTRGKVQYEGKWRFPESVAIEQAAAERHADATTATRDIYRWHNDAIRSKGNRAALALDNLRQVNDPLSVGALNELLRGSTRPGVAPSPVPMKLLYIQLLGKFQTYAAASVLRTPA
ncbi:MAG: hypothetical protein R3C53_11255 [Pirellulaceae bacterium]